MAVMVVVPKPCKLMIPLVGSMVATFRLLLEYENSPLLFDMGVVMVGAFPVNFTDLKFKPGPERLGLAAVTVKVVLVVFRA